MAMYTQAPQKIEIIVKKDAGSSPKGATTTDPENVSTTATTNEEEDRKYGVSVSRTQKFIKTNVTHAVSVAKQVGGQWLNYAIGGIGYTSGDQALQEQAQRSIEIIQDTGNVASSIGIGLTYGSAGGPVGAVLGAVFGAITSISSLGIKYAGRTRDYDVKTFKLENNIAYKQARANISLTNGRLR